MSKLIKNGLAGKSEEKVISIRYFPSSPIEAEKKETGMDFAQQLEDARKKAEKIIEEAKLKANSIEREIDALKEKTEAERRRIFEKAKEEGYSDGLRQGRQKGYEEMEEQIQLAKRMAMDTKNEFNKAIERSEPMILSIALKSAEKIVQSFLSEDEERFIPIVRNAIEEAKHYKQIQVYVHPTYYSMLVDRQEELFSNLPIDCQIFLHPKEELDESACLIETEGGLIDAGIDSQFEELTKTLYAQLTGDGS
ncbi:flagellar assembly protein FliH [Fervidibacillus albus]|uniref:Flagellar assembly protein FliH n=1 Tax=Fervidibacillus albus TaxID=2980026 RepID=A0A9E8RX27_9BACI|nr:flagellar assembly protein FliH [Fervidibacillus albus]WAA10713.1 flagellar assembly protein FliH [Fervidibacillus albus]